MMGIRPDPWKTGCWFVSDWIFAHNSSSSSTTS